MGGSLKTERTLDQDLVASVMNLPEIVETVAEDGFTGPYIPDVENEAWLQMIHDQNLIALYRLHGMNSVTVQIHAHVLPKYRKTPLSKQTGWQALEWVLENTEAHKIIALIPSAYPNVRDFTLSFGFELEGTVKESYKKNGEIHDQWLLGITRNQIELRRAA